MSPEMPFKAAALLLFATIAHAVELRVATFNIGAHFTTSSGGVYYPDYSLGPPGTPDHDSVRAVLGRIDADVVALEEIHGADVSGGDLAALAASLGYPYVFVAPSTGTFDTSLRVAVLSRFPFLFQTTVTSPAGAKEMNRLIPVVRVDVPGTTRDPIIAAAHLKSGTDASDLFQRTIELRRLTNFLTSLGLTSSDNFIVAGDFNLSSTNRTFTSQPVSGLPASFVLGADIAFPIPYSTDPTAYFSNPAVTRILPRQLNGSTATFPSSGSTIDVFLASGIFAGRPLKTEIYNSALDDSNSSGLPKSGSPLPAGTSAAASDHLALFGDFELDAAQPYALDAPGVTVTETFAGFTGNYDPYPWQTTGGIWQGIDDGNSTTPGFRAYGSAADPSLGFLPGGGNTATARFANRSSAVLTALQISYTAEQWRAAQNGSADNLGVELIANGTATPLPALSFQAATNLASGAVPGGISTPKSATVTGLAVPPGAEFEMRFTFNPGAGAGTPPSDVFINEFHYDNAGTDSDEFVEIVTGPGFTGTPSDVTLWLYNGDGGGTYSAGGGSAHALSTFTAGAVTPSGHRIYSKLIPGIQNGPQDGFALVVNGAVNRFISYEGSFAATAGPAAGMTAIDIGVSQTGSEPVGQSSLGLSGNGGSAGNFAWTKFTGLAHSPGQPNPGQTFSNPALPPQGIAIDNLAVTFLPTGDSDGDGLSDADEWVFGTDPLDAASRFQMTAAFGTPAAGAVRLTFPSTVGRSYTIERSTDLSHWSGAGTISGTGTPIITDLAVNPLEPAEFYRVRVTRN